MNFCKKLLLVVLAGFIIFGCSHKSSLNPSDTQEINDDYYSDWDNTQIITLNTVEKHRWRIREAFATPLERKSIADHPESRKRLLRMAYSAIGTPYVLGGTKPGGFDCSGLVMYLYKKVGITLPRTAREQSVVGRRITNEAEMHIGDIVAFRHPKRGYHTGIYIGDGKFIHAPRTGSRVKTSSLSSAYFAPIFLGARRVNFDSNENLVQQAQIRLASITNVEKIRAEKRKKETLAKKHTKEVQLADKNLKKDKLQQKKEHKKPVQLTQNSKATGVKGKKEQNKLEIKKNVKHTEKVVAQNTDKKRKLERKPEKNTEKVKVLKSQKNEQKVANKNATRQPEKKEKRASAPKKATKIASAGKLRNS